MGRHGRTCPHLSPICELRRLHLRYRHCDNVRCHYNNVLYPRVVRSANENSLILRNAMHM